MDSVLSLYGRGCPYTPLVSVHIEHLGSTTPVLGESTAIAVAAEYFDLPYRFSNAEEESQGIDGWIGEHPVQVKPADSYKKNHVFNGADTEETLVITYEKKKHTCYIWNPEFVSA